MTVKSNHPRKPIRLELPGIKSKTSSHLSLRLVVSYRMLTKPEPPQIDIAGLDVAPVGSDIGATKKDAEPPPPDTSGITLADKASLLQSPTTAG